jgi:hypothetical protein
MSIKHIWSVLCRRSVIDGQSNNLSLFDVFEQIGINIDQPANDLKNGEFLDNLPRVLPYEYSLVTFWTREEADNGTLKMDIKLEIVDPKGAVIKDQVFETEIPEGNRRMRHLTKLTHLFLTSSGVYCFKIMYRSTGAKEYTLAAELPLEVKIEKK